MPIYEFYCAGCHVIFNFLSRTIETKKRPCCPRCGRTRLERRPSSFAISARGEREDDRGEGDEGSPGIDENRLERAMDELARQADDLDENDTPAMAGMMRKLYDGMGVPLGPAMSEAIRRMEAGEDPDRIEDELGEVLEEEDSLAGADRGLGKLRRRIRPPRIDPTLHEL